MEKSCVIPAIAKTKEASFEVMLSNDMLACKPESPNHVWQFHPTQWVQINLTNYQGCENSGGGL